MTANKEKQNLRVKKVCERIHKKINYGGFNELEIKYIKTVKDYEQTSRELDNFYAICKRKPTNQVDWDNMSEEDLDYFDYIYKKSEKLLKRKSKLEEKVNGDKVMEIFVQLNINSVSF